MAVCWLCRQWAAAAAGRSGPLVCLSKSTKLEGERLLTRFDLATRRAAWCCKASRLPGVSPGGVRGNGLPVLVVMDVEIMGAVVVMDVNWR